MRVTEVELTAFALPFERPYVTAAGELERREMYLLRLQTDAGIEGLGEAVPLSLRGGPDLRAVFRGLLKGTRRLRRADLSDFAGDEPFLAAVDAFVHTAAGRRLPGAAKAAIEMAILDLAGKASGRPLHALLGVERPAPVRCNATLVAGAPDEVAADAARWAAEGFDSFKLKVVVVAHGAGLKFFLDDLTGTPWEEDKIAPDLYSRFVGLTKYGVEGYLCQITYKRLNIDPAKTKKDPFLKFVPSGVATVAELQSKGFAYIKVG